VVTQPVGHARFDRMRAVVVAFEPPGLILRGRFRTRFTVTYGEILTVERRRGRLGLRLHTRTSTEPINIRSTASDGTDVETSLRISGVRVVDCWGAIIAPSLDDFEAELARGPAEMRQSSDNA
jgi:hypothetical protein